MTAKEDRSRTKGLLVAAGQTLLLFAGFVFILFSESSKVSTSDQAGGTVGVANADVPYSQSAYYGQSSYGGK